MFQHFFIEGKYFGFAERQKEFVHAELVQPASYWFLCPVCGEHWAKVAVASEESKGRWAAIVRSCRDCGGSGSIQVPYDFEYQEHLPLAVLQWEFLRELERQGLDKDES